MQFALSNAARELKALSRTRVARERVVLRARCPWKILIWIAEPDEATARPDWLIRQSRRPITNRQSRCDGREVFFARTLRARARAPRHCARQGEAITRMSRRDGKILTKDHKETRWWWFTLHALKVHFDVADGFLRRNKLTLDFILRRKVVS